MNFICGFYFFVINYHKLSGLKQHPCIISVFMGQESGASSTQGFTKYWLGPGSRYWLGPGSHLKLKVLFQAHVVVGRIHFLAAVELMAASSRPAGRSLTSSSLFFQGRLGTSFKGLT